jgi:hypothetical protein
MSITHHEREDILAAAAIRAWFKASRGLAPPTTPPIDQTPPTPVGEVTEVADSDGGDCD